jgi:hypothetical protein
MRLSKCEWLWDVRVECGTSRESSPSPTSHQQREMLQVTTHSAVRAFTNISPVTTTTTSLYISIGSRFFTTAMREKT